MRYSTANRTIPTRTSRSTTSSPGGPPFTLRSFLWPHRWRLVRALGLVILESAGFQAGPLLTQIGIDEGVTPGQVGPRHRGHSVLASIALACAEQLVPHPLHRAARRRPHTALRIRVFSHMQRQSLDFYTGEKAGVLMTRMTSDIEALSQLFQEGLVNFAVQGLTLVVITIGAVRLDRSWR